MRENVDVKGRRRQARLAARVLPKIEIGSPTECWEWRGHRDPKGYGRVGLGRAKPSALAHRVVYELLVGPIETETLDHLCRNRACVNPAHLEEVSMYENGRRGESLPAQNARKTHCDKGHEFTPENTYWRKRSSSDSIRRECRRCRREQMRAWKASHAA